MSKKKSHEEFIKEVVKKRPGYTVYGIYKDNRTKIEIGHDKCGFRWFITPSNFLGGKVCPKCTGHLKKSHEEFVKEVAKKRPGYTVYGMYKTNSTKIEIGHDKCGHRWFVRPDSFLRGNGCPKCAGHLKKSHEEFVKELAEKMPGYTVYGMYKNARTKIEIGHDECGHRWFVTPDTLIHGHGCPKCAGCLKKSHEEFVKEVVKKRPGYTVYGMYKSNSTKIEIGHDECGHRWFIRPDAFLRGRGCPRCAGNAKKSHEEFVKELAEKMPGYTVYGMYKNATTKIEIGHDKCGHRWLARPYTLLYGTGCPKCNESKGESTIAEFLKKHNIDFVYQHTFDDCRRKNTLPFDFYCPSYNAAIEYDGIQHFCEKAHFGGADGLKYRQENDKIKTDYCAANGIKLVRIRFDDDIGKVLGEALGW